MQQFTRTSEFSELWSDFYKIIKSVSIDLKENSIEIYSYSLYDRALFIFDAYVLIEKTNNVAALHILLRSLYEIKVKASKYEDDRGNEINITNINLKNEIENFLKKIEKGESFTSQVLWMGLKNKKYEIKINSSVASDNKRNTIKKDFENADLGFDYEILYWLTSLFVHTSPLSLAIEQKSNYPENEIFDTLSSIVRDIDMLNINVLGTVLWITKYLFSEILSRNTNELIDKIWESMRSIISQKYRLKWTVDSNVELGSIKFITTDGEEFILTRPQRK